MLSDAERKLRQEDAWQWWVCRPRQSAVDSNLRPLTWIGSILFIKFPGGSIPFFFSLNICARIIFQLSATQECSEYSFPEPLELNENKKWIQKLICYWVTWIITNTKWEKTQKVKPRSVCSPMTFIRLWPELDMTEHYKSWGWKGRARRENCGRADARSHIRHLQSPSVPAFRAGLVHSVVCSEAVALTAHWALCRSDTRYWYSIIKRAHRAS